MASPWLVTHACCLSFDSVGVINQPDKSIKERGLCGLQFQATVHCCRQGARTWSSPSGHIHRQQQRAMSCYVHTGTRLDLSFSFIPWPKSKALPLTHLRKSQTGLPTGQSILHKFFSEMCYSSRLCQLTIKTNLSMPQLSFRSYIDWGSSWATQVRKSPVSNMGEYFPQRFARF